MTKLRPLKRYAKREWCCKKENRVFTVSHIVFVVGSRVAVACVATRQRRNVDATRARVLQLRMQEGVEEPLVLSVVSRGVLLRSQVPEGHVPYPQVALWQHQVGAQQ